ncbi:hypothetical protein ACFX15_031072 [Malus domestica]
MGILDINTRPMVGAAMLVQEWHLQGVLHLGARQGRPLNSKIGTRSRFHEEYEGCGVEQLVPHPQHYAGEGGWQGVHTESGIRLTIFGLLPCDIIFYYIPNSLHPVSLLFRSPQLVRRDEDIQTECPLTSLNVFRLRDR